MNDKQRLFLRRTSALLSLVGVATLSACGGGSSGGGSAPSPTGCQAFDCQGLLENVANDVLMPTFTSFASSTETLNDGIVAYCDALGTPGELEKRAAAQQSWIQSMGVWQQAEVMQVGPLVENSGLLRDQIYSWPNTNSCAVDQDVVFAEQNQLPDGTAYSISSRSPERRGMDALEYVLFSNDLAHTCPANITALNGWNQRPESERQIARCTYAKLAAQDLQQQAQSLVARWDGREDDFLVELTQPGTSGSRFSRAEDAVNAVSDALFYVEKQTKDAKLAQPLGLKANVCGPAGTLCPQAVESPYSNTSKSHIRNNLLGFQQLFLGNAADSVDDRLGFDDYLSAQGNDNVSAIMEADIANALSALDDTRMPGTLADTLVNDIDAVRGAHAAVKAVTDRLKNEFLSVQGLLIPGSAAGDGD